MNRAWLGFCLALLLVVVWGVGWGVFTHVRMDAYVSHVVPVGQVWTDPGSGTTYRVLETQVSRRLERGSLSETAPDGAVFYYVKVQRDQLTEDSPCSFQLLGPERMLWSTDTSSLPEGYPHCSNTDQVKVFWMNYLIPESLVGELVGITIHYMQWEHNPALALPAPS